MKIGFFGFGKFAQIRYEILSSLKGVELVGFFDNESDADNSIKLKRFYNENELIDSCDTFFVSVPPFYASKISKKLLKNKKNIFCEKPPAISCEPLNDAIFDSTDSVLAYGFNHRLHDSILLINQILESNIFGRILWMRGRYGKEIDKNYKNTWRCDPDLNGGGILIDQGIHLLDIMNLFAGGFDSVQALLSNTYLKIPNIEDNAFINMFSSKTKISASLHSTITQWRYLFSLEIFLENGSLILNGLRTSSGNYGDEILTIRPENGVSFQGSKEDKIIKYDKNNSWHREIDTFLDSVKNKKEYPYAGINDARDIMRLIDLIYTNKIKE